MDIWWYNHSIYIIYILWIWLYFTVFQFWINSITRWFQTYVCGFGLAVSNGKTNFTWLGRAAPSDHVRFEALCGFRAQQPFQNGTVCDLAQKSAAAGWQNIPCWSLPFQWCASLQKILNHGHFIHNLTHPRCWNRWLGVYWVPKKMPPDWSTHVWFEHVKLFYQIITWKMHDVTHFIQLVTYRVAIILMDRP